MDSLNPVNLIQAGTTTVGILGALLLWRTGAFKGIALVLAFTSTAAVVNILEETGLTREFYLISPIFVLAFGPALYLAAKQTINKHLNNQDWWHLAPVLPLLFFTQHTQEVIAIGTVWRLAYTILTIILIVNYQRALNEQRSDSDDYSLKWLVWLVAITACFNFIDLVRLNVQPLLSHQINVLGQGINNVIWLLTDMVIIYKLVEQKSFPQKQVSSTADTSSSDKAEYETIFTELDQLFTSNQWFLTPRITLQDLTQLTGIQSREISRAINLVAEKSFNEYVNQYRVDYVCQLFQQDSSRSVTDVFNDAGFSSKASFNKAFKQFTKMTPSEYKKSKTS